MKEFKTQLNRIEGKINQILDLLQVEDDSVYVPTKAEIEEIHQFAKGTEEYMTEKFFEDHPYMKFEHTSNGKWQPITEEMRIRLRAAKKVVALSEEDVQFVDQMLSVDDGTEGQFRKVNAILYTLYKKK